MFREDDRALVFALLQRNQEKDKEIARLNASIRKTPKRSKSVRSPPIRRRWAERDQVGGIQVGDGGLTEQHEGNDSESARLSTGYVKRRISELSAHAM